MLFLVPIAAATPIGAWYDMDDIGYARSYTMPKHEWVMASLESLETAEPSPEPSAESDDDKSARWLLLWDDSGEKDKDKKSHDKDTSTSDSDKGKGKEDEWF